MLLNLFMDYPFKLPGIEDLVSQQEGHLLHHNPAELQLIVWMISGIDSLQEAFHRKLLKHSWLQEVKTRINHTNLVGMISPDGVEGRIQIPLRQLWLK